ncbi:MAG: DUF2306 domain-containing protein [Shimia sp.]
MTFEPFLTAPLTIQIHAALAFTALVLGPVALWRRRRDRLHKVVGYVWVLGMGGAALSALAIPSHFSPIGLGPIHLLSVYALWGIVVAMRAVFARDIATHKATMEAMYVRGLCLAGAFNLLPGRTSARSLIPDAPWIGFIVIALVFAWAFWPLVRPLIGSLGTAVKKPLVGGGSVR